MVLAGLAKGSVAAESEQLHSCVGMAIYKINKVLIEGPEDVQHTTEECTRVALYFRVAPMVPPRIPDGGGGGTQTTTSLPQHCSVVQETQHDGSTSVPVSGWC